jgi:NADH dehydrogenase [ubiquinone] 1 alpha subcomplex assembly factor 7
MIAGGLAQRIARRIRNDGPMSLSQYLTMALYDPDDGYYHRRDPIGAAGDFVTAPEISQVFGELLGLWCIACWQQLGEPDPVVLAELGPGSGTLMTDLLRAAGTVPRFRQALRLSLIEASPILRARQQAHLRDAQPQWLDRPEDLPAGPLLLVANEFLDALPIRQLVRGRREWCERLVGLDPDGHLALVDGPESPALSRIARERLGRDAPPGAVVEICPAALSLAAMLGTRLGAATGAALFIDYGYAGELRGATLRAVRQHRPVLPLDEPGAADLSADVDFAAFAQTAKARGGEVHGPVPQGRFLTSLGAPIRLAALAARASPAQHKLLESGVARLLDPGQMGTLFQVMALSSPGLQPPGFAEEPE